MSRNPQVIRSRLGALPALGAALMLAVTSVTALGVSGAAAQSVLRVANSGEPDSLDPHHVSGTWEDRILGDMFMGLTTEATDGTVIPGAAESWTISDDSLTYTFAIRDHTWSDGTPHAARVAWPAPGAASIAAGSMPLGTTRIRSGRTPARSSAARTPSEMAMTASTARL